MSIIIKKGASIDGCNPKLLVALITKVDPIFRRRGANTVITSGTEDYKHNATRSRHYSGDAVDIRSWVILKNRRQLLFQSLKKALGSDFVVLFEAVGTPNEHFHIHFAPVYNAHQQHPVLT